MNGKLKWLCRRGTKELDLLFEGYLEHDYPGASCAQRQAFVKLLDYQDPRIIDLLFGRIRDDDPAIQALVACFATRRAEKI